MIGRPSILLQAPTPFDNDTVWNYEVGEKSAFLDNRMIFDATAYYERWNNPQFANSSFRTLRDGEKCDEQRGRDGCTGR